jgi:hypothetical protein
VEYGAGRYMAPLPIEEIINALRLDFISQPIFFLAMAIIKISVGFALLLFAETRAYQIFIILLMGTSTLVSLQTND